MAAEEPEMLPQFDPAVSEYEASQRFKEALLTSEELIKQRKFNEAMNLLANLERSPNNKLEARRLFNFSRAIARKGRFKIAIDLDQKALKLDPALFAAHYNISCYYSLAKNERQSIEGLRVLAGQAMQTKQKQLFANLMLKDSDLEYVRSKSPKEFSAVHLRLRS